MIKTNVPASIKFQKGYSKPNIYFDGTGWICRQAFDFGKLYIGGGRTPIEAYNDFMAWFSLRHA